MEEKKASHEPGFSSDARKNPQRIVFITRKTSAKVKGEVPGQVMAYPHLLLRESIVFQVLVIAIVLLALVWDAPLEQLANPLVTPNPAKAPWYFLGLQELLHYFPPLVAGILIPTLVVIALVVIPYFNINVEGEQMWSTNPVRHLRVLLAVLAALEIFLAIFRAWTVFVPTAVVGALAIYSYFVARTASGFPRYLRDRAVSWWVMTWFICVALVLTVVGTFFRGPGWSWVWPWRGHAG
jgi:menaquinol-cytochrome c reductase cytochrome b/c subunit